VRLDGYREPNIHYYPQLAAPALDQVIIRNTFPQPCTGPRKAARRRRFRQAAYRKKNKITARR
jgi:hypothetical protein